MLTVGFTPVAIAFVYAMAMSFWDLRPWWAEVSAYIALAVALGWCLTIAWASTL